MKNCSGESSDEAIVIQPGASHNPTVSKCAKGCGRDAGFNLTLRAVQDPIVGNMVDPGEQFKQCCQSCIGLGKTDKPWECHGHCKDCIDSNWKPKCVRPNCPCVGTYNGVFGEYCSRACKTGQLCQKRTHYNPPKPHLFGAPPRSYFEVPMVPPPPAPLPALAMAPAGAAPPPAIAPPNVWKAKNYVCKRQGLPPYKKQGQRNIEKTCKWLYRH